MNKFFKNPFVKKTRENRKAFTLIELLVAMTVFALFISVLASSYLFLTRAQRDTNELRKIYSEGRFIMDELVETARGNKIAYDCYNAVSGDATCDGSTLDATGDFIQGSTLAVIRPDGKRVVIKLEDTGVLKKIVQEYGTVEWEASEDDGYYGFSDSGFQALNLEKINVDGAHFEIHPAAPDPAVSPYVRIFLSLSADSQIRDSINFDLQTTVSLRSY